MRVDRLKVGGILSIAITVGGCSSKAATPPIKPWIGSVEPEFMVRHGQLQVEYLLLRVKRPRAQTFSLGEDDLAFKLIKDALSTPDAPYSKDWDRQMSLLSEKGHGCQITLIDKGLSREDPKTGIVRVATKEQPGDPLRFRFIGEYRGNFVGQKSFIGLSHGQFLVLNSVPSLKWNQFLAREGVPEVIKVNETQLDYDVLALRFQRDPLSSVQGGHYYPGTGVSPAMDRQELAKRLLGKSPEPKVTNPHRGPRPAKSHPGLQ